MSSESLIVHNPNHSIISFRLDKGLDADIASKSKAKQKKLIRTFSHNVALPSRQSVDLVVLSGLTLREIKASPEYLQMQRHFTVMYDSSLAEVEETEEETKPSSEALIAQEKAKELEDLDPVEAEDLDTVLPEDELESVDEFMHEEYPEEVEIESKIEAKDPARAPEVVDGAQVLWAEAENTEPEPEVVEPEVAEEPEPEVIEPEPEPEPAKAKPKAKKSKKKTVKKKVPAKRGKK